MIRNIVRKKLIAIIIIVICNKNWKKLKFFTGKWTMWVSQ